jgi:hypothetical protein
MGELMIELGEYGRSGEDPIENEPQMRFGWLRLIELAALGIVIIYLLK